MLTDALERLYRRDLERIIEGTRELLGDRGSMVDVMAMFLACDECGRRRILDHLDAAAAQDDGLGGFRDLLEAWE